MKKRIAIQGYAGSFHEQAARHYFGVDCEIVPARTFQELVHLAADAEKTEGAVMAIENSIAGSIIPNYTLLLESRLEIAGEIYLRIHHHLLALPGVTMKDLKEIHSHHMAIHQCRAFLNQYPEIHAVETADTALSAHEIASQQLGNVAAIASKHAAEMYGLHILAPNIETVKNNYTRFLVLTREAKPHSEPPNKASIHFRVAHEPGSLLKALEVLAAKGLNLSKIQSFPVIDEEWRYNFHCDVEFTHPATFEEAMMDLEEPTHMLRVLGVYKKGETIV